MVKRYSQREKKKNDCPQPFCFYQYNQGIGGADLLDRFISQYNPTIHGKKWYWHLFLNCLQMLLVASWRIHCAVSQKKQLDLLDFTRSVVVGILNKTKPCSSGPSGIRILSNSGSHYPVLSLLSLFIITI